MTKQSREIMEREAEKRSQRQCSTGQADLDKAISWYLKVGFEDGFKAGYITAQQEIKSLAQLDKEIFDSKEFTREEIAFIKSAAYAAKQGGEDVK